jgi:hydroxysqualene dehydroxylase
VPLWVLYSKRRVPGTSLGDYVKGLKLLTAGDRTVAELFARQGALYRRFWEPFAVAVLNTAPEIAAARLLVPVIRETLAKGADASRPLIARRGLSDTFVDPALDALARRGAEIRLGCRVVGLECEADRLTGLALSRGHEGLAPGDAAVLATPPWTAAELLPGLTVPDAYAPIVNVHFRLDGGRRPLLSTPILGLVGGTAQWLFVRDDVVSVTVSAAHALAERAARRSPRSSGPRSPAPSSSTWRRCRRCASSRSAAPPSSPRPPRSPAARGRRPHLRNLVLAGDYTDTGLPATIEGAIRSGRTAARLVLR